MIAGADFIAARNSRNIRVLARMLSLAENDPASAYGILREVSVATKDPGETADTSGVIGLTGPPGVGKSTLVSALVAEFRSLDLSVGVLALDPSSPFRGGALLGDRIRMNEHADDAGVFIRSMATRGLLGGLSRAAWLAVRILDFWGFDRIVVETTGVGQNEIDIVSLADTTVLVLSPAAGDEVQVMKAGIMEAADLFVINKSDLPGANTLRSALLSILPDSPAIVETVANVRSPENGVSTLAAAITSNLDREHRSEPHLRRDARLREEVRRSIHDLLSKEIELQLDRVMSDRAHDKFEDPAAIARDILEELGIHRAVGTGEEHDGEQD